MNRVVLINALRAINGATAIVMGACSVAAAASGHVGSGLVDASLCLGNVWAYWLNGVTRRRLTGGR